MKNLYDVQRILEKTNNHDGVIVIEATISAIDAALKTIEKLEERINKIERKLGDIQHDLKVGNVCP